MTAREIISPAKSLVPTRTILSIDAETPAVEVIPRLLEAPDRMLAVTDGRERIGVIDERSLLEALGSFIQPRDDSSIVTLECAPDDYSASIIAHAVEDSDAHLVDLWSRTTPEGRIRVTLRVRQTDPAPTVRNLERYGFDVVEASGRQSTLPALADERLDALRVFLNV